MGGALRPALSKIDRYGIYLAAIPAIILIITAVRIFSSRMTFPVDLEWIEGGQLLHAHRLLEGKEIYTEPKQGFMPYSYPPGHTLILAFFGGIFGLDFWLGRFISLSAMGGVIFLLAREVHREFEGQGARFLWPALAVGSMLAAFPLTGGWYDLIRNDELVLLMVIGSAVLCTPRGALSRARFVSAVLLMNLAAFTKQTAAFYLVWILLFQLFRNPRRGLALGFALALAGLVSTLAIEIITERRYLDYTIFLLAEQQVHEHMYERALNTWDEFAPYLTALPVLFAVAAYKRLLTSRAILWLGMLAASYPASMLPYAKQGGYLNNLLPVAVLAGPVALCLAGAVLRKAPPAARITSGLEWGLAFSFGFLLYNKLFDPAPFMVTEERRANAARLYERLDGLGDSVLIPHHPFVAIKAGSKIEQFHEMPWVDFWLAGVKGLDLRPHMDRLAPEYVVLSGMEIPLFNRSLGEKYFLYQTLPPSEWVPPITGFPSHPKFILKRQPEELGRKCDFDFERGYRGFQRTGNAFRRTMSVGAENRFVIGMQGRAMASSLPGSRREDATGVLETPSFRIESQVLHFLIGGGNDESKLRLELLIDGRPVRKTSGPGVDIMQAGQFEVAEFVGDEAKLRLIDRDLQSHILLDDVCQ